MVSREQFINGLIRFVDDEMMPQLNIAGKWIVGTYISILSIKSKEFATKILEHPLISPLGLQDCNGMIDEQLLLSKLSSTAERYGNLTVPVPVIGNVNFTHQDVEKLRMMFISQQTQTNSYLN